jgi:hypothetical protein
MTGRTVVLYKQKHGRVRHGEEQSPWPYVQ